MMHIIKDKYYVDNIKGVVSMKAKQLFEELGYEWKEDKYTITYTKKERHFIFRYKTIIIFSKVMENIYINNVDAYIEKDLLRAINKQVEELGWKNE